MPTPWRAIFVGAVALFAGNCSSPPRIDTPAKTVPTRGVQGSGARIVQATRTAWTRSLSADCPPAKLELVLPFYEGIRLAPAGTALEEAKSEYLELAYPGPLSIPLVAWRCGEGVWTAVMTTDPDALPVGLWVRASNGDIDVRLECFTACAFQEVSARGTWREMAAAAAAAWNLPAACPPLASRYDRYRFFVREWVSQEGTPQRVDWSADALAKRMAVEPDRTMAFVFGLDPNEVDLEGRYFWRVGADNEMHSLVRANPRVGHHHWLNLRTYKYAIPRLGITRDLPAEIRASAKTYAGEAINDFDQYVFKAVEMCLGARRWQQSRLEEMKRLVNLGFSVIAFDEFPTAPRWGTEACHARDHLHRPNDFADEWRVAMDLVRRLAEFARERGVLLSSEEPSAALLRWSSGYMDGSFNEPPDMYEHWQRSSHAERIPLFSAMFGRRVTPYTRPKGVQRPPPGWLIQEKISGPG